jgi:hypothetical protein
MQQLDLQTYLRRTSSGLRAQVSEQKYY